MIVLVVLVDVHLLAHFLIEKEEYLGEAGIEPLNSCSSVHHFTNSGLDTYNAKKFQILQQTLDQYLSTFLLLLNSINFVDRRKIRRLDDEHFRR